MLQELQNLLFTDVYIHILKELKIMIVSVGVHSLCLCCDSPILARHNPFKPNKLTPCLHCKLALTQDLKGCRLARSNSTKLQILANLTSLTTTIDYATKEKKIIDDIKINHLWFFTSLFKN